MGKPSNRAGATEQIKKAQQPALEINKEKLAEVQQLATSIKNKLDTAKQTLQNAQRALIDSITDENGQLKTAIGTEQLVVGHACVTLDGALSKLNTAFMHSSVILDQAKESNNSETNRSLLPSYIEEVSSDEESTEMLGKDSGSENEGNFDA